MWEPEGKEAGSWVARVDLHGESVCVKITTLTSRDATELPLNSFKVRYQILKAGLNFYFYPVLHQNNTIIIW